MTTNDPVWVTVAELSRAFGARTLSPVDAVEALIGRIRRRNPALHAYIAVYEADARLAAEAADKAIRAGHRVGRRRRCGPRAGRDRHRHGGLRAHTRGLVRPRGAQGDGRTDQHLRRPAAQLDPRHARTTGALGRGRRADLPRAERP